MDEIHGLVVAHIMRQRLRQLIRLAVGTGAHGDAKYAAWCSFLVEYTAFMDLLTQSAAYADGDITRMQQHADRAFALLVTDVGWSSSTAYQCLVRTCTITQRNITITQFMYSSMG